MRSILITGGTGSLGYALTAELIKRADVCRVVIYSRDELKQQEMRYRFGDSTALRFFIGDVRDKDRLQKALRGVDTVIHAAALKHVPVCEYNPAEAVKTNILGAMNVIDAAINAGVKKVLAVSTDKAVNPVNLYGATKLCAEKLFVQANAYASAQTIFSVLRYGNVANSRGSVLPIWRRQIENNESITITSTRMTRFWVTLSQAVSFVFRSIEEMTGGEIFVPVLPSVRIMDMAHALNSSIEYCVVGIRPGEKIHETLISGEEGGRTKHSKGFGDFYIIEPAHIFWERGGFSSSRPYLETCYSSDTNNWWLKVEEIQQVLIKEGDFGA